MIRPSPRGGFETSESPVAIFVRGLTCDEAICVSGAAAGADCQSAIDDSAFPVGMRRTAYSMALGGL